MMYSKTNMADGEVFFSFFSIFFFISMCISELAKLRAAEMNSVKFNHEN